MKSSKQIKREARELFRFCLVGGRVDEDRARLVVAKVLESRRRGCLTLLEEFHRLLRLDQKSHTAEIESAVPLPPELQTRVQTRIEGLYDVGLTTLFDYEPALIGGMRIQVGWDVYDGSVRSRMAALAKSFDISNGKHAGA